MYFSEALSSTSNELQQVSSGRSLNELQARSARSKRSLQAELWVNPGPRGGVDPRQRARAQMPVSLVYWEDAATGTSARSGQGRERIEEDARVRAYAAYGLDGAE